MLLVQVDSDAGPDLSIVLEWPHRPEQISVLEESLSVLSVVYLHVWHISDLIDRKDAENAFLTDRFECASSEADKVHVA